MHFPSAAGFTVFRLDVAGLFNEALANPTAFGLTNVTQAAAPGLQPGTGSYNTDQIAPNANEYLFWDDLHPTTTVHAHLAQAALELLLAIPGDFSGDGRVDTADYVVWRAGLGSIYTVADYETWRARFGTSAANSTAHFTIAVPEPISLVIFAAVAVFWAFHGDRW